MKSVKEKKITKNEYKEWLSETLKNLQAFEVESSVKKTSGEMIHSQNYGAGKNEEYEW